MNRTHRERNFLLGFCGIMLLMIAGVSFFAPASDDSDKSPTTYNSGTAGIKAAYLLLGELGYSSTRWEQPPSELSTLDAAHTTLIFVEPEIPDGKLTDFRADIAAFLQDGGRVLATGPGGATLLPHGATGAPTFPFGKLCLSAPEGRSPMARAGDVYFTRAPHWTTLTPAVHVEQWCGADAAVVSYRVGAGEAIWWSSALPMTNARLRDDASLKLLLASIAASPAHSRKILFDEYLHNADTSIFDLTRGLPLAAIAWQTAAVALLLLLSFGRRNGPIRTLARIPRTSPVEFAESMGQLYRRAGASQAATENARNRLLRFLRERCGVPRDVVAGDAATIAEMLPQRFPGNWSALGQHLEQASEARYQALAPRSALALVKALNHDLQMLKDSIDTRTNSSTPQSVIKER